MSGFGQLREGWAPALNVQAIPELFIALSGDGLNDSGRMSTPEEATTWCQNLGQDVEVGVPHQLPIQGSLAPTVNEPPGETACLNPVPEP